MTEAIDAVGIGKIFHPAAGVGDLLRGKLRQAPVQALAEVSFRVAPGEVLCLMGPNGAGKSTLLRILAGMLTPTAGRARVLGVDVGDADAAYRRRVAFVVGEERSFHWPLSGRQNLAFFGALHGHAPAPARAHADLLLERVGLTEAADRPFSAYSRGMRQRLALARGLLGAPDVLLLDEPTLGLDPQGARDLRRFLRDDVIRGAGRTAVIGTNDPAEARALGDRVLFLDHGRTRGETLPDRIEAELGLLIAVSTDAPPSRALWFWRVLVAFGRRELATMAGYRVAFVVRLFSFAISVLALVFFSKMVGSTINPHLAAYGGDYLAFVVVGLVVMDFQQIGVTSLAQRIRYGQIMGLFEAELATPVPSWIVLSVGPVYEFAVAIARAGLYFALAVVLFGVRFPRMSVTSLLVGAPLVVGAFVGIGLVSAATQMLVRRNNPVAVFLASASFLLSGVAYPVSVLPPALRLLGRALPMTHALDLVRGALLRGATLSELTGSIVALALFAGLLIPTGAALFVVALRRARADGSLTHY